MKHNVMAEKPFVREILEWKLKAMIQSYMERMNGNRLVIPEE